MPRRLARRRSRPCAGPLRARLSAQGWLRRYAHYTARGLTVLCTTLPGVTFAAQFGSPAWLAQTGAGIPGHTSPAVPGNPGVPAVPGGVTTPNQAIVQASRSIQDLSRAAALITAAQNTQSAARALALQNGNPAGVADGLAPGGLQYDQAQAEADLANEAGCTAAGTCTWLNAGLPTETLDAATQIHDVTVEQNDTHALLTWQSFNIGTNTHLHIDQSAGTQADGSNDWVALNRITGSTAPSQILGHLDAEGSVYVINPNGVIFGGSSQVNTHSLIASTLNPSLPETFSADDRSSNQAYLTNGVVYDGATWVQPTDAAGQIIPAGDVRIEAGAVIQTGANGFSMFVAPHVGNAGQIIADDGQAILAGGYGATIRLQSATQLGFSVVAGALGLGTSIPLPASSVTNTGVIQARRGTVLLVGSDVTLGSQEIAGTGLTQSSTIVTTTSVTRPGGVTITADRFQQADLVGYQGVVRMDPGTLIALLPDQNGATTTSSAAADAAFTRGAITISGASIRMMGDAMIESPGQNVTLTAVGPGTLPDESFRPDDPADGSVAGRVFLDSGAIIDVAGIADIRLPISVNFVTVPRLGQNELADSPLQRDSILFGSSIVVDRRRRGIRSDGTLWYGTPIANVNGYVDLVPRTVDQMLINAGNITLNGQEVLAREGSFLNLDAGFVHYLGGEVPVTRLVTQTGGVIDIADANPYQTYVGFAGEGSVDHPRWNETDVFGNPILGNSAYETDYIDSGRAGTLTIGLSGAFLGDYNPAGFTQVLDGTISAHAFPGRHQVADGNIPSGGRFQLGRGGDTATVISDDPLSVVVRDEIRHLGEGSGSFTFDSLMPGADTSVTDPWNHPDLAVWWTQVSGTSLREAGFSNIGLTTAGVVRVEDSGLHVTPGGSIDLRGSIVTIGGDLIAEAGRISVTSFGLTANPGVVSNTGTGSTPFIRQSIFVPANDAAGAAIAGDIEVLSGVTISTRGQWVNDSGLGSDDITGGAFVNAGSITLSAWGASGRTLVSGLRDSGGAGSPEPPVYGDLLDLTGSILLDEGSVLDVTGGGRVLQNGRLNQSDGIVQGRGGSVSLRTYDRLHITTGPVYTAPPSTLPGHATIALGGDIRSLGLSGGGTFTLQGDGIGIGGDEASTAPGTVIVDPEFFADQDFGAYVFDAIGHDATIADGVTIRPIVHNLLPSTDALLAMPTGTDLLGGSLTTVGVLDDFHRQAASFALYAWGTARVGDGALIQADPGASVTIGGREGVIVLGDIVAHGGRITLTGDTYAGPGYSVLPDATSTTTPAFATTVLLGAESLLDVSGVAIDNLAQVPVVVNGEVQSPHTGRVLAGGTVTLTNDSGFVVALSCADVGGCDDPNATGARIDVSGADVMLDIINPVSGRYDPRTLWSNAGTLRIGATAGLYFDGTIDGHAGGHGLGATLAILPIRETNADATGLLITQTTEPLPDGAAIPGTHLRNPVRGQLTFAADRLDGSGIANVHLGWDPTHVLAAPVKVTFGEDVTLEAGRSIDINSAGFASLTPADGASDVRIVAPYVRLHGDFNQSTIQALTSSNPAITFSVVAQAIDLGGRLSFRDFGAVSFTADGDLRFDTDFSDFTGSGGHGELYTFGDLTFTAARIYPMSNTAFAIVAGGTDSTIRILGNEHSAAAGTPLSVGGALLIDAAHIVQSGVLRAPAGQIVLGVTDPASDESRQLFDYLDVNSVTRVLPIVATQTVVLAPDVAHGDTSITSVSLGGLTIPDGQTVDGTDWTVGGLPLGAPPAGRVTFNGESLDLAEGAIVDLSGGGHVQAQEWIPGTGGSRDVLSQYNQDLAAGEGAYKPLYQDGRAVYAILPGYDTSLGAYDLGIVPYGASTSVSATVDPMVGRQVYLSGIPGLPAGVYTLLPGQYATLPGAFRVVQDTRATNSYASGNGRLPDGTEIVAGHFVDAFTGAHTSLDTSFYVQSSAVWRRYSEYLLTDADEYFSDRADRTGTTVPQLLRDAGQLVLAATQSIDLGATLLTAPAANGIGARVDIAAPRLEIVGGGHGGAPEAGVVQIDAGDLSALGASSLLLGGTRTRTAEGDVVTVVSSEVVVDNGNEALVAPEILLTAGGSDANEGVFVRDGATLTASGTLPAGAAVALVIGQLPDEDGDGGVSGDGALLRLSNGGSVPVLRHNVTGLDGAAGTSFGTLSIGEDATLTADGIILFDSTGATTLAPTADFHADTIEANSNRITLVAAGSDVPAGAVGLVLSPDQLLALAGSSNLTLRSRSEIDFVGDYGLSLTGGLTLGAGTFVGDGGDVRLSADHLVLDNFLNAGNGAAATGDGTFDLSGRQVVFGPGDMTIAGFDSVTVAAAMPGSVPTGTDGAAIVLRGHGSFDVGAADLHLVTPLLTAEQGADGRLVTTGAIRVDDNASPASTAAALGGALHLVGDSVDVDTTVQTLGGTIDLVATGGNLTLGADAHLQAGGVARDFFDVERDVSGGTVRLTADEGDVVAEAGSVIDVSAPDHGGDAGTIAISAEHGAATLGGTLLGGARNGTGGHLSLDTGAAIDLDALANQLTASGIDGSLLVRTQTGNLVLSAGQTLVAGDVQLVADGGGDEPSATDGNVVVHGTIDASGDAGGAITLYGRSGVDLDGTLDAHSAKTGQRGGTVTLGTVGTGDGTYDDTYGYEHVGAGRSGTIRLRNGARIDVSGIDPANELAGGRVVIRAPLLDTGDVNVVVDAGAAAGIVGARDVTLEAFATWNTTDATTGDHHFDGIIDPAGHYDSAGNRLPDGTVNADHTGFYANTLLGFVQAPGFTFEDRFAGTANFHARPGIDLVNDDPSINGGDIRVLSNWNLGAGTMRSDRSLDLLYRYHGLAPVLTLRAAGDAVFEASLSDGFFQYNNPFAQADGSIAALDPTANGISPEATAGMPLPLLAMGLAAEASAEGVVRGTYDSASYRIVSGAAGGSADPLAVVADGGDGGDVLVDGHVSAVVYNPASPRQFRTIVAPTMIRTGIGSIDIGASGDIRLLDMVAPGVIYTAGRPDADAPTGTQAAVIASNGFGTRHPWIVDTGENHPVGAGDLTLTAGGDIAGVRGVVETDGLRSGNRGTTSLDQYWWPWLQGLCATFDDAYGACGTDTSGGAYGIVNFGNFDQGILSAGGNVRISAGRDIVDLSVSLPTTFTRSVDGASLVFYGGGNLDVASGRDILGGDYFVSDGSARVLAGRNIGASGTVQDISTHDPVATIFALQDAQFTVRAQQDITIGDLLNPSYMNPGFDLHAFGIDSSLRIESIAGDVLIRNHPFVYQYGAADAFINAAGVWPANLDVAALGGSLTLDLGASSAASRVGLAASPTGELNLLADGVVTLGCGGCTGGLLGLFDVEPEAMRTPLNPTGLLTLDIAQQSARDHSPLGLHRGDSEPVRIYSRSDDIDLQNEGQAFTLDPNKPAYLRAGRDIVDLSFIGQHLYGTDLSIIQAQRDIYWHLVQSSSRISVIQLGGPGTLLVSAGRDLGPLLRSQGSGQGNVIGTGASGIITVGAQYNPFLDRGDGADLVIEFGVKPGVAVADFESAYLAPDRTNGDVADFTNQLIEFVYRVQADDAARAGSAPPAKPTAEEAWAAYQAMPVDERKVFVYQAFYAILDQVGLDYNDRDSLFFRSYGRGYEAIATLFPESYGYTRNHLDGEGANGSDEPVRTGDFDMRDATVQTQQGGSISIIGPGGSVLVGSTASPAVRVDSRGNVLVGPSKLGVLALQAGAIRTYTDRDVLLAQSRIFTQQGGDVLMWSSNGDINAGKGAKTTTELPTTRYLCDAKYHFCVVDATAQVSGAGIAALQSIPGEEGGNVNLIAPAGTVDAGDAGIRVSGNLNIAAAVVANANNIQVQGTQAGVPSGAVDTGALGAASAAAAAAAQAAADVAASSAGPSAVGTLVKGEVVGYGSMSEEQKKKLK